MQAEHLDGAPAERVRAHDAEDDAEEAGAREDDPGNVEVLRRAGRLTEVDPRERDRDDPDRDVQPEDPVPGDPVDDRAADDRADRDREAGEPAPRSEVGTALLRRDLGGEDRQRQRRHDRGADALERARDDQHVRAAGERREHGRDGEQRHPEDEEELASVAVAERGAGEQQDCERQRVGVHDPLEARETGVQVLPDHRQRGDHDEVVERRHEECDRRDCERPAELALLHLELPPRRRLSEA